MNQAGEGFTQGAPDSLDLLLDSLYFSFNSQDYRRCIEIATRILANLASVGLASASLAGASSGEAADSAGAAPESSAQNPASDATSSPHQNPESKNLKKDSAKADSTKPSPANPDSTKIDPAKIARVWFVCAMSLYYLGDTARAIEYLSYARDLAPRDEPIALNLAELLRLQGEPALAVQILSALLPSKNPDLYYNLACALNLLGEKAHAKSAYQEVLKLSPNDKDAAYNLANLCAQEGDTKQAIALYKRCDTLQARFNLAHTYTLIDDMPRALALYKSLESSFLPRPRAPQESEEAYNAYQDSRAEFYFNYANAARYAGHTREAERLYQTSYAITHNSAYVINYAYLLLSVGVFERGFSYYQERLHLPKAAMDNSRFFDSPRHIALENPADIRERIKDARVLVFYEQGFGDSLMFGRFIDMLQCARKFVFVQESLKSLFALRYEVVDRGFDDFDYCLSLPSLPYVLGISMLADFAHNASYLQGVLRARESKGADLANVDSANLNSANLDSANVDSANADFRHCEERSDEAIHKQAKGEVSLAIHRDTPEPTHQSPSHTSHTPSAQAPKRALKIGIFFHSNPNFAYATYKSIKLSMLIKCFEQWRKQGLAFTLHCLQPEPLESISDKHCVKERATTIAELQSDAFGDEADSGQKIFGDIDSGADFAKACKTSAKPAKTAKPDKLGKRLTLHTYKLRDFLDAASVVAEMDLVVSVDSVAAHLAIALGVPSAVLAYKRYDWRWGELAHTRFRGFCGGEVFAQSVYGEWGSVLNDLRAYLLSLDSST
ncbi:hypothetical protein BA723_03460 [Helicobacter sp. CLO-3]|uniref:tetratricopeptide repeat protein n=1 Tax=Helicobacter sp. CLO-3 TaxID=211 RepID=UPI000805AE3F|nr:tetratricopeptide repeat protein [Helicobacter sp. CLO-3]OBV29951.1 hypothetical protein BA723_03460 [Helicobacter sp. CLO-3]